MLPLNGIRVHHRPCGLRPLRDHPAFAGKESRALTPELPRKADCVLIATGHDNLDYAAIFQHAPLAVDTRNASARVPGAHANVVKA